MEIKPIIEDNRIKELLLEKLRIEKEIERIMKVSKFEHFSAKKFVGDLGEHLAMINIEAYFDDIGISKKSNDDYDIIGTLKKKYAEAWNLSENVKIEVKTRFGQKGNPHLRNIDKKKFDLLVFVSLNDDYSIHFIGMVKNEDLPEPDSRKRVVFNDKIKLIYGTSNKFEMLA